MTLKNKLQTKVTMDIDLWDWLKLEAKRRRTSASAILRELAVREMERIRKVDETK